MKFTTFPCTVGIEYTFVPDFEAPEHVLQKFANMGAVALATVKTLPKDVRKNIHEEFGAIEIPSPVHQNYTQLASFYNKLRNALSSIGRWSFTPRFISRYGTEDETYYGTGGGHVHVGIPPELTGQARKLFLHNVLTCGLNHFYVNWFFQEWHDDDTLPDMFTEFVVGEKKMNGFLAGPTASTDDVLTSAKTTRQFPIAIRNVENRDGSCYGYNRNNDTVEFRLFDAPRDFDMVCLNVDFALAYVQYVKRLSERGVKVVLQTQKIRDRAKMTANEVRYALEALFSKLELNYDDYHDTYFQNYVLRAENGKL